MKVASFDAVLESVSKLDPWLQSLGIEPKSDRWHQAVQMVRRAKEQREFVERGGPRARINNYMDGLFEAMEIHEIVEAFHGDFSPALKPKLTRALCGPISPFDERPKNDFGHLPAVRAGKPTTSGRSTQPSSELNCDQL